MKYHSALSITLFDKLWLKLDIPLMRIAVIYAFDWMSLNEKQLTQNRVNSLLEKANKGPMDIKDFTDILISYFIRNNDFLACNNTKTAFLQHIGRSKDSLALSKIASAIQSLALGMENETRTPIGSGLAIASLVCGIAGFITFGLAGIAGVICGILALKQGQSKGMAIAGLVTGGLSMLFIPFAIIIAAIAIPNLLESRKVANEAAAAATLKSGIFPAQVMFQSAAHQDADGDGIGEYGLIGELTGRTPAAGMNAGSYQALFGPLARGTGFTANGYNYAIYLPDGFGAISDSSDLQARHAPKAEGANTGNVDDQERFWVAYAWPVSKEHGRRVFAICQDGNIRTSPGPEKSNGDAPEWNAVLGGASDWNQPTWPIYVK